MSLISNYMLCNLTKIMKSCSGMFVPCWLRDRQAKLSGFNPDTPNPCVPRAIRYIQDDLQRPLTCLLSYQPFLTRLWNGFIAGALLVRFAVGEKVIDDDADDRE